MSASPPTTHQSIGKQQQQQQQQQPKQQPRGSKEKQQPQAKDAKQASPSTAQKEALETRRGRQSLPAPTTAAPESKKLSRRSSKPIFDWFQRKLAGTVRARRASESARSARAIATTATSSRDKRRPPLPDNFHALTRTLSTPSRGRSSAERNVRRRSHAVDSAGPQQIQGIVSLDDDDSIDGRRENSTYRSSLARESLWSPTSNLEADEDASVRPLPPSSPPSPSPSHSSSSFLSDPRTFRSLAASTKPTTLLSVDLANGMAHIAQAPPTPSSTFHRIGSHTRGAGGSSGSAAPPIHFSALPTGHSPAGSVSGDGHAAQQRSAPPVQAPQLTHYHPRNNPRPSSPPPDNASVLTLASSAFGIPGARPGIVASADAMSVSQFSHFGGSRAALEDRGSATSEAEAEAEAEPGHYPDTERDRDAGASVRALRPRSSRRGSWESEASGWSAKMGNASTLALGPDTPMRGGSLWSASVRADADDDDDEPDTVPLLADGGGAQDVLVKDADRDRDAASSTTGTVPATTPRAEDYGPDVPGHEADADAKTPRYATVSLAAVEAPPLPASVSSASEDTTTSAETTTGKPKMGKPEPVDAPEEDVHAALARPHSVVSSEAGTDMFVSAPSTPLGGSLPVTPAAA